MIEANRAIKVICLSITGLLLVQGFVACGKKGPPVAPQGLKLQAVTDLRAEVAGCEAVLRWTIPRGGDNAALLGFDLQRAEQDPAGTGCPDCPLTFRPAGRIDIKAGTHGQPEQMAYRIKGTCGFRYFYKVAGFADRDVHSPDSNVVRFELGRPHEE